MFCFFFPKLSTKAKFSNHVKPIDLADQDDGCPPKSCLVSGWGRNNKNSNYSSSKLMEVNVTLIDDTVCGPYKLYCSEGEIGPGRVCIFTNHNNATPLTITIVQAITADSVCTSRETLVVHWCVKMERRTEWCLYHSQQHQANNSMATLKFPSIWSGSTLPWEMHICYLKLLTKPLIR